MTDAILYTLGFALMVALVLIGWRLYSDWRERKDEEALSKALRDPERWEATLQTEAEQEAANRAALRRKLKQGGGDWS